MNFLDLVSLRSFLAPFLGVAIKPGVAVVVSGLREYAPRVYDSILAALATVTDAQLGILIVEAAAWLQVPAAKQEWFGFVVRELHRRAVTAAAQKANSA
jgi:hypothetical protein